MNYEQSKAIKALERAFKKCSLAGVGFFGDGGAVYAFDSAEYHLIFKKLESDHYISRGVGIGEVLSEISDYKNIETYRSWVDSGGS